ncbi:MAG: hypothetical protein IKR85_02860 [Clostridia bacterium]|nr:hypothetical protein [Clostridia bacterium]
MLLGKLFYKIAAVLIALTAGLAIMLQYDAETMDETPEWLNDTLLINTFGSDEPVAGDESPYEQYVCAFDFGARAAASAAVPYRSVLLSYQDEPVVLFQKNYFRSGLNENWAANPYAEYAMKKIAVNEADSVILLPEENSYMDFTCAPMIIYDIRKTGTEDVGFCDCPTDIITYYYLRCIISSEGKPQYQLVSESTYGEFTEYACFNDIEEAEYVFAGASPNGTELAWQQYVRSADPEESGLFVSDGETVQKLKYYPYTANAVCWLDNDKLLFAVREYGNTSADSFFCLYIWDIENDTVQPLNALWNGDKINLPDYPAAMAVNKVKTLLAVYMQPTDDWYYSRGTVDFIWIINLSTGEYFEFKPWNTEYRSDYGYFDAYFIDDGGTIIYEAGDMIYPQLTWG